MNVQVLVSTMHQTDYSLIQRLGLECDAVVVNQCGRDSEEELEYDGRRILWINSTTRGLSRSRNIALDHAKAEICLLADDDEELCSGYVLTISDAFLRYPNAGIIGFQAQGIEDTFKTYRNKEGRVGYLQSMRMASVELAFRREDLIKNKIRFNEAIGVGTEFPMGEENALLFDSLSKGLKIYYIPQLICKIHLLDSSGFSGYSEDAFFARGFVFTAMSRQWSKLLILQFALRKYRLYKDSVSLRNAYKNMLKGRKEYIKKLGEC